MDQNVDIFVEKMQKNSSIVGVKNTHKYNIDSFQATYTVNNYGISRVQMQNLFDWVMFGSGVILLLSIILLSFFMHDYWATMLCLFIFGFGFVLFCAAFFPFLYLEYGLKKNDKLGDLNHLK